MCVASDFPSERRSNSFSLGFSSQLLETIALHTSPHGRLLAWMEGEELSSRLLQGAPVTALNLLTNKPVRRRGNWGQGVWPLVKRPEWPGRCCSVPKNGSRGSSV